MRHIGKLSSCSISHAPSSRKCYFSTGPASNGGPTLPSSNLTGHDSKTGPMVASSLGDISYDSFTKRRSGKKTGVRSATSLSSNNGGGFSIPPVMPPPPMLPPSLSALPAGLLNPLLGSTDGLFPDLRDCLTNFEDNKVDLKNFPYPLDSLQLEEIRSVVGGFVSASSKSKATSGLPRIVTMTYAEAMGDGLLESVALGLAKHLKADCLTFHARDFGGMLEGCSKAWFGQSYFTRKPVQPPQSVSIMSEDDLELTDERMPPPTSERWLSHFLKSKPIKKLTPPSNSQASIATRIKEDVNLFTVLSFLASCMDRVQSENSLVRVIHLSGFGSSLTNPLHRSHIQKFAQEANKNCFTLVLVSESNPKADVPTDEDGTNSKGISTMPLAMASHLLVKGRCERLAEIPNTPEYDSNWLLDRGSFGGLRLFLVPPRDPIKRSDLITLLERDHESKVRSFNLKRISDVLDQLGIPQSEELDIFIGQEKGLLTPLLLSEAIYLSYMASSDTRRVTTESLSKALKNYIEMRALQKEHFSHSPLVTSNHQKQLDPKLLSKYEKRLLPCIVTADMVKTRFEDIGSLERVKRSLYELITFPLDRPELFTAGILKEAVSGILLFGPPGTGKTMLAKAVAAQSKSNFIAVNSSNIYDMYVGEGEKNVKALFRLARKLSPCIIFIDEVDAILDARSNAVGKASRVEILNEFMAEWDGLLSSSASARVMVMAATNRPFALDDAVLRRLPRRILVDLPDFSARRTILNILLKDDRLDPGLDLDLLAGPMTQNYSGSDLKNMCIAAAMNALRRNIAAADVKDGGVSLTFADFEAACHEVPASISDSMDTLQDLRKWDNTFGEGKKKKAAQSFGF